MREKIKYQRQLRGAESRKRGFWAEIYAAYYLFLRGYRILAWRYRCKAGEIDLLLRRGDTVIVAEIKIRPDLEIGSNAVLQADWQRRQAAATHYLRHRPRLQNLALRFDLLVITPYLQIHHIESAWESLA